MTWIVWLKVTSVALLSLIVAGKAWMWNHDAKVAKKVTTTIVERSKAQGSAANAKAATIYNSAKRGGAAGRLRKDKVTCPDC